MITNFEERAPRLHSSGKRRRARSKNESAWCFKVIFSRGSWVSIRSNWIWVKNRHPLKTLHASLWIISHWLIRLITLLLVLVTHSTSLFFLYWSCPQEHIHSGSSSSTFSETFIMAHFVFKPILDDLSRSLILVDTWLEYNL